jgi:hypothetical protein
MLSNLFIFNIRVPLVDCCVVFCLSRELPFHGSLLSISFDFKKSCYFHTLETEGTSFSWIPPIDII